MAFSSTRLAKAIRRFGRIIGTNRMTTRLGNAATDRGVQAINTFRKGGKVATKKNIRIGTKVAKALIKIAGGPSKVQRGARRIAMSI